MRPSRFPVLVLAFALMSAPAAASGPEEFIRGTGARALSLLAGPGVTQEVREERFRKLLNETFDMRIIGRFVLGRHWRLATREQRTEYMSLFEDFLVKAYANKFQAWSGNKFDVGQVIDLNARDKLVNSEVRMPRGEPVRIAWRVRGNSGYRIIDVMVEGISMSVTQREEFAAVIRNAGGHVEGLLAVLRRRTGRAD